MRDYRVFSSSAFVYSIDLSGHPVRKMRAFIRELYYFALEYISLRYSGSVYTCERLLQYKNALNVDGGYINATETLKAQLALAAVGGIYYEMQRGGIILMMHDLYLIIPAEEKFRSAGSFFGKLLDKADCDHRPDLLFSQWIDSMYVPGRSESLGIKNMAEQTDMNRRFLNKVERRIIVTATMSAGKSTLINALIGKQLTRTAQGACTGNISYLCNKPFEDGKIHLIYDTMTLDASSEDLLRNTWENPRVIASYFRLSKSEMKRICLIDTPGVNAATHEEHGEITYQALLNETYDTCVCVLSAKNLGTSDEWAHLQWLSQNVPAGKMVFVVNMLDLFDTEDDDFNESLGDVRNHLKHLGYVSPIICPLSAKCAYYSKMMQYEKCLSKREEMDYHDMVRKFSYDDYNLSQYYDEPKDGFGICDAEIIRQKCGFDGFEKCLLGG